VFDLSVSVAADGCWMLVELALGFIMVGWLCGVVWCVLFCWFVDGSLVGCWLPLEWGLMSLHM
jgi:hypothetical protein